MHLVRILVEVDTTDAVRRLSQVAGRLDARDLLGLLADELIEHVEEAFATSGFGEWAPLDPATVRAKGSGRILVDTGGLLASLTSPAAVEELGETVRIATDHPGAGPLKRGARGMPERNATPTPERPELNSWATRLARYAVDGGVL